MPTLRHLPDLQAKGFTLFRQNPRLCVADSVDPMPQWQRVLADSAAILENSWMSSKHELRREISLAGAVMLGLGSIVGTGVFVSLGIAAGVAGPNVLWAILIAALVATCNGLSSAQLAAVHPVSGGTYEYGYRWLTPGFGFTAGWLFLCAKSASAATAALGLAGYLRATTGNFGSVDGAFAFAAQIGVALMTLAVVTTVVVLGIKRTSIINSIIVAFTLTALLTFVLFGWEPAVEGARKNLADMFLFGENGSLDSAETASWFSLLSASALLFVAYTGYGRIATMGEEVAQPHQTIPRAMILTLAITMVLYLSVGFVAVATVGADGLSEATGRWAAPLLYVTDSFGRTWVTQFLAIGAITAMLGVMINLLLGLSRVVLAMSRRSDLPGYFSVINSRGVPMRATLLVAVIIGALVCIGDVKLSWSFSAMTVLIYYALTNLCAIRVPPEDRIFPIWPAWVGLVSCLTLAFFIRWEMLIAGVVAIGFGFAWRSMRH